MQNVLRSLIKVLSAMIIAMSLQGCTPPTLEEYRNVMLNDQGYQANSIPRIYVLRMVDKGSDENDIYDCFIKIDDQYWQMMRIMQSAEIVGFPPAYRYSLFDIGNTVNTRNSIGYQYRCDYQGRDWMGIGDREVYYPSSSTLLSFERPIDLNWKQNTETQWHPSYIVASNSNSLITNEGCFTSAHINQTRSIENRFMIKNIKDRTLYINHQLTQVLDMQTGNVSPHADRFIIELLDSYNNNLIALGAGQEVNFKLKYGVTIAGPGDIEDSVIIVFKYGDTSGSFNREFKIGAHMKFTRKEPAQCP